MDLDCCGFSQIRESAGSKSKGRHNGRPRVACDICSSCCALLKSVERALAATSGGTEALEVATCAAQVLASVLEQVLLPKAATLFPKNRNHCRLVPAADRACGSRGLPLQNHARVVHRGRLSAVAELEAYSECPDSSCHGVRRAQLLAQEGRFEPACRRDLLAQRAVLDRQSVMQVRRGAALDFRVRSQLVHAQCLSVAQACASQLAQPRRGALESSYSIRPAASTNATARS